MYTLLGQRSLHRVRHPRRTRHRILIPRAFNRHHLARPLPHRLDEAIHLLGGIVRVKHQPDAPRPLGHDGVRDGVGVHVGHGHVHEEVVLVAGAVHLQGHNVRVDGAGLPVFEQRDREEVFVEGFIPDRVGGDAAEEVLDDLLDGFLFLWFVGKRREGDQSVSQSVSQKGSYCFHKGLVRLEGGGGGIVTKTEYLDMVPFWSRRSSVTGILLGWRRSWELKVRRCTLKTVPS